MSMHAADESFSARSIAPNSIEYTSSILRGLVNESIAENQLSALDAFENPPPNPCLQGSMDLNSVMIDKLFNVLNCGIDS